MAVVQKRDRNGQIYYEDDRTGSRVTKEGKPLTTETTVTTTDKQKGKEQLKADKEERKETKAALKEAKKTVKAEDKATAQAQKKENEALMDEYYKDVYGMSSADYNNAVISSGSGSEPPAMLKNLSFDEWKEQRNNPSATAPATTGTYQGPSNKKAGTMAGSAEGADLSAADDKMKALTDKENETLKTAAKTAKDERPIDTQDVADYIQKVKNGYLNVDDHYVDGIPASIIQAWKGGKFGNPDTKDAKNARNYLIANSLATAIGNFGAGIKGGEQKESMWQENVKNNFNEGNNRRNEKFSSELKNEIGLINDGSKYAQELDRDINKMFQDKVLGLAAKRADNYEDQLGMLYVYQLAGDAWNKMSNDEKWALIGAQQAIRNGDAASYNSALNTFSSDRLQQLELDKLDAELQQIKLGNMGTIYNNKILESNAKFQNAKNTGDLIKSGADAIGAFFPG